MNNLDDMNLDKAELKKLFNESELRVVQRFLEYVTKTQSDFSLSENDDAEIQAQVKAWISKRKAQGHRYTARDN